MRRNAKDGTARQDGAQNRASRSPHKTACAESSANPNGVHTSFNHEDLVQRSPVCGLPAVEQVVLDPKMHSLRHAQLALSQLLTPAPSVAFRDAAAAFLDERELVIAGTTAYQYRLALGRCCELFGDVPTCDVGQAQALLVYRTFRSKTTASKTVNHLRAVLRWARRRGWTSAVDIDPKLAKIHHKPRATVVLGRDAEAFFAACDEYDRTAHRETCEAATAVLRFLMATGWRVGETCALAWPNLSEDCSTAYLEECKTGPCHKIVGVEARAFLAARRLVKRSHWVFPGSDPRSHVAVRTVQKTMRKVAQMAGLVNVVPHTARHSAATRAMRLRLPTRVVQEVFGWTSEAMFRRYAHIAAEDVRDAADAISVVVKKASER